MRSVEASLHVTAIVLNISFPGGNTLQEWANLTDKIASEIKKAEQQTRSAQKAERLKRLGALMIPADGFRLQWRNHVAHAREKYEDPEARQALSDVGRYLRKLSDAIS